MGLSKVLGLCRSRGPWFKASYPPPHVLNNRCLGPVLWLSRLILIGKHQDPTWAPIRVAFGMLPPRDPEEAPAMAAAWGVNQRVEDLSLTLLC